MWEEIEKRGQRYLELKRLVADPAAPAQPQYAAWLREYGRAGKVGALYEPYAVARKSLDEAEGILADPAADEGLKGLAQEELSVLRGQVAQAQQALLAHFAEAEDDEDADRNVILEVYAGVGGDESALFVGDLFGIYKRYVERRGWKLTVLDSSAGRVGGMSEISFRVVGEGAFGDLRFEGGGHRVQRVPVTEAQGRIHTSMARVAVLPEVEEVEVQIDPKDVRETFCAAGGPGGQNVNKVASQCQLIHIPTGIQVHCLETRSQAQNKVRAWQILRSKLYALEKARHDRERGDQRMGQLGSGDRSERIRTYNFQQSRCTDHRLEGDDKNWPLRDILDGHLDDLIAKLKALRKQGVRAPAASAKED